MLLLAGASLAVTAFVVVQLIGQARPAQDPIDDSILNQLPPSPIHLDPSPTTLPLPTQIVNLQPAYTGEGIMVTIKLTQRTWLRVFADEQQRFIGLARPGDQLPDFAAQPMPW